MNDIGKKNKIEKILLMQPNFAILGKRSWTMAPYNLGLLSACLHHDYQVEIYDPNFRQESEEIIREKLRDSTADVVGMTTFSTEYTEEIALHARIIRQELPEAIIVLGGVLPTVWIEKVISDPNIDYFVLGEGEYRFADLLNNRLNDGIAFRRDGENTIHPPKAFIDELDRVPFPRWTGLEIKDYLSQKIQYAPQILPRAFPYAMTITSRGCPYECVFCAARTVSGTKVRMRSAENVLREIDWYVEEYGIKEMIFLDDHFLHSRKRAMDIMEGLISRNYDFRWKCVNVAVFSLNEQILELMMRSGSYQMTISIESGDQFVVNNLIKKPVDLVRAKEAIRQAKSFGFELIVNFVIGTPGETWQQIRRSLEYAEAIDVNNINIHIATPLPKTELMEICLREGFLKDETSLSGYTVGQINTEEWSAFDLQILRAYEWDRINFSRPEKVAVIARMNGLTLEEADVWRRNTRRSLGSTVGWAERTRK